MQLFKWVWWAHLISLKVTRILPINYHRKIIELLTITQDAISTEEKKEHSQQKWKTVLINLKKLLE